MNEATETDGGGGVVETKETTQTDVSKYEEMVKQLQTQLSEKEQILKSKEEAELNATKQKATEENNIEKLLEIERAERAREAKEKQDLLDRLQKIEEEQEKEEIKLQQKAFERTLLDQLGPVQDMETLMILINKNKKDKIVLDSKGKNINGFNADGIKQIIDWVRTEKPFLLQSGQNFQQKAPSDVDKRNDAELKKIAELKEKNPRLAGLLEQAHDKKKQSNHAKNEGWKGLENLIQTRKK